jgi:uncharacterized repeat protein (TIGR01451 family)
MADKTSKTIETITPRAAQPRAVIKVLRWGLVFGIVLLASGLLGESDRFPFSALLEAGRPGVAWAQADDPTAPTQPVKLVFVHHSTGEAWLADGDGELGKALRDNNYFVSDTNYGWGPVDQDQGSGTIGDHTDIPHWYSWFTGPHRDTYLAALYAESGQHPIASTYSRLATDPGGPNTIILFKSCFLANSELSGNPDDPPAPSADNHSGYTVAEAKRIYLDLLPYFAAHQEKLFVVITSPPMRQADTTPDKAANARAFSNWLVTDWLTGYAYDNVAVFDYYTVLTTNGGSADTNDLGATTGNHHRYRNNAIEHTIDQGTNYAAYGSYDSHPTSAGHRKAVGEFVPLLNIFYHKWQGTGPGSDLSTSTKQVSASQVHIGDRVTYTIALRNTGTISVSALLTDVVPGGLSYIPNTLQASGGAVSASLSPTLRWNGWILTSTPITITYAATVTTNVSQSIVNAADVAPTGYAHLTRTASINVISLLPDLSVSTKQASTSQVHIGDRVTYTIALRNTGTISVSTLLTDVVPGGLNYIPNTLQASGGTASASLSPTLRWNGWILTSAPVTITYAATVTTNISQSIVNAADIAPTGYAHLTRTASINVISLLPDLSVSTKQASTSQVRIGDRVTYTIALRNTGTISVSTLLTDVVPGGLSYIPNTLQASGGSVSASLSPTLRWNGWILTSTPITITYAAVVATDVTQAIVNTATIAPADYTTLARSATIIVNGYVVYLPLIRKN